MATATKPRSRAKAKPPVTYQPFRVNAARLLEIVNDAGLVASGNPSRPVLTMVRLDLANNVLTASATDSYMLIETSVNVEAEGQEWTRYLSPNDRSLLLTLLKATGEGPVTVTVSADDPSLSFCAAQAVTVGSVIDKDWPDFKRLWATKRSSFAGHIGVNPAMLARFSRLSAYKKAIRRSGSGACRFEIGTYVEPISWAIIGTDCRGLLMPMRTV